MANNTLNLTKQLYHYMQDISLRESALLQALREETKNMPAAVMQITPEQGQFMSFLVQLIGAVRTLEIGVYTGYSAISVAQVLPDNGQLIACDVNREWTDVAKRYWQKSGLAHKITLQLAPAADTLDKLLSDQQHATFDFAFIDANKNQYDTYYEQCLSLIRPGGLIAIDNVLWGGNVADNSINDDDTVAIRALNSKLQSDSRVDLSLIPIGDGLSLVRKR